MKMSTEKVARKEHTLWQLKKHDASFNHHNHLNTAWNARTSFVGIHDCSEEDLHAWRQFPSDIDMSVWFCE
jgi:hypothetical protein